MGGGDVEEGQLVGALGVVHPGQLDRVAGVAQLLEVDALDHAPGVDVEARDDADGEAHAAPAARERERVLEGEPALVERGADDRALDAVADQALQRLEVGELGDAAGRDDRAVGRRAHVAQQVEVRALEHAVLVDVGDHVAGAALGVEPREHVVEVAAVAGPAARGQRAAADVEARPRPGRRARRSPARTTRAARARRCRC